MLQPSPRFALVKELADRLGLDGLAHLEAELVRQRPVPPRLIARLFREHVGEVQTVLSHRERQVMVLLVSGFSRDEMAEQLHLSEETIKHHLKSAYSKLGVNHLPGNKQILAINAFLEEES